jgi:hypothetical protein
VVGCSGCWALFRAGGALAAGGHKSSYSGNGGGDCVEVARRLPRTVAVRDSKDPRGPVLAIGSARWRDFIADVKAGRHDLT